MYNGNLNQDSDLHKRMGVLHTNHYVWLLQASTNITKNRLEAEDLIGDLYLYLYEKSNPKIHYKDSFNLMYAYRFLQTRWLNKIKKKNKYYSKQDIQTIEIEDVPYDMDADLRMMEAYDSVQVELERLSITRDWSKVMLFNLYYGTEDTMMEVAKKIGICHSTMFVNIKKIREHLKQTIHNPFQN